MKSTGIVRKVDELGRVVIPKEIRRTLGIGEKDPMEIFVDGDNIILKRYEANMACAITGMINANNHVLLGGKLILSTYGAELLVAEMTEKGAVK